MFHIKELSKVLKDHFDFYKPRQDCLAMIIISIITLKTVNFVRLATAFITKSLPASNYKRIQRFFRSIKINNLNFAKMVLTIFRLKDKKLP